MSILSLLMKTVFLFCLSLPLGLNYSSSNERISTGIPRLDTMLSGKGLLSRQHSPCFRHRRHRQDEHCRTICGGGMQEG